MKISNVRYQQRWEPESQIHEAMHLHQALKGCLRYQEWPSNNCHRQCVEVRIKTWQNEPTRERGRDTNKQLISTCNEIVAGAVFSQLDHQDQIWAIDELYLGLADQHYQWEAAFWGNRIISRKK